MMTTNTTARLTPEQLQEGRRLHKAATIGPWQADLVGRRFSSTYVFGPTGNEMICEGRGHGAGLPIYDNIDLIAWMRTNLPALLAAADACETLTADLARSEIRAMNAEMDRDELRAQLAAKEAEVERLKLMVAKIAATVLAAPLAHDPDAKYTLAVQYAHTAVPEWPDIAKKTAIQIPKAALAPSSDETGDGK